MKKTTLEKLNKVNIDKDINCHGEEINFNSNKKYKYFRKITFP